MAACSINIAEELYSLLTTDPYETDVQTIDADTQPNPEELKKVRKLLDKAYNFETSRFQTRRGNCIPNGMFELFGEYSGIDAQAVRDELYDWLEDKSNDVRVVVTKAMVPFPHRSLTGWLMTMRNAKYEGDELTLYALCRLHHRHAAVYTMAGLWTTVKDGVLLSESELMEKCDIKLLNLGGYRYGVLTKLEITKKRLKVKEIDSLRDELIHIRENTEKAHNTRPRKTLNYKDLSEGKKPIRPARKHPYKPLPGSGPSEIRLSAQESIEEIRNSRIVGSVTIKTEEEKPKVKKEKDLISSNTRRQKGANEGEHCPKHCPKAKKTKSADPDGTLPYLPISRPIEESDKTLVTMKASKRPEDLLRSAVTETEKMTSMVSENRDIKELESNRNAATRAVVTDITSATTDAVIEIVPTIDPTLETETEVNVHDSNTGTQPRAVVTEANDNNATGKTGTVQKNTQQKISEDYEVPEEIASVALLMLQEMSQPNPQETDDNDEYALPVGTERLPDIVSEMNEERGIKNVVNYDAEIPEEMKLQIDELRPDPDEPKEGTHDKDKDNESDETIIYDASEFDDTNKGIEKPDNKQTDEGEKTPKG